MDPVLVGDPTPTAPEPQPESPLAAAIRGLFQARPRLRRLNVSFQRMEGRPVYVLEDPGSSAFYRAGESEYRFLECLDGTRTVGETLSRLAATSPETAIDPGNAIRLIEMLKAERLLDEPGQLPDGLGGPARPTWIDKIGSVLFWRISLGNPDRFFRWLCVWMGWVVHPLAWIAGLGVIAVGAMTLLRHADRMRDATLTVLAPHNWIWFGVVFVALRAIHETWHALTCRRWGGHVRDIGIVLILFLPVGYVDVTASWGLPSRWHRLLVSSAGVFIELCLAAVAAVVWANTDAGLANTIAWQTVLTAGVSSLLVNANPLMRFDGYYMASDLLDLPNLYARGQLFVRAFVRRVVLGVRSHGWPPMRERGWWMAAIYGPSALVWRIFVLANLLAAAGALFRGAGILLVCMTLVAWWRGSKGQGTRWFRGLPFGTQAGAVVRVLLFAGAAGAVLFVPWRSAAVEPAIVDWADRYDVYAGCPGIVEEVGVRPGARVDAGVEVARIGNPDLKAEADRLRVRVAKEDLRARFALREGDMPSWSAAHAACEALQEEWEHVEARAGRSIVRAPAAGVVYGHRLDRRVGQYVREGELLFTLGNASEREAIALIPQERLALYGLSVGDLVDVWVPGRDESWSGTIVALGPAARERIDRPALTALGGGHLAVRSRPHGGQDEDGGYELQDPQFEVRIRLMGDEASSLRAGERAYVRAKGGAPMPLWRLAYGRLEGFWSRLLGRRRQAR